MRVFIFKVWTVIFLFLISFVSIKVDAKSTGHTGFTSFIVPVGSRASLLVDTPEYKKEEAIQKVKRKVFGTNTYTLCKRQPILYIGEVIFSRANSTSSIIEFDYSMKVGKTTSNSISLSGGLNAKVSGKIKAITLGGDVKFDAEWEKVVKVTEEEKTSFTIKIKPHTKLTLHTRGVAEVTNGGCKTFFLGITLSKGNFEIIEVVTEYYELLEEFL